MANLPQRIHINEALKDYGRLARHVDEKVEPLASDAERMMKETRRLVRDVNDRIKPLIESLEKSLKTAHSAFEQGRKTLASAEVNIGKKSPLIYQLDATLKDISAMARSIRSLADYLERHPDALLYGKGKPKRR